MNPDVLLRVAEELVEQGAQQGVRLRILGSLGIRHHIGDSAGMLDLLGRVPTRDIDFMGYSEDQARADRMFRDLGYEPDDAVIHSLEYGIQRLIYHRRDDQLMAEIFLDQLRMAHTLDFRGRLELDYPTISLVDLLLSKLQIHRITEKDIKDMIALLAKHDLGPDGREVIDVNYLLELTSDDWGLYHTAITNLEIVKEWANRVEALDPNVRPDVVKKVGTLISKVEAQPKTLRWKLRGKIGTRVRWYEEVGDVHR
jgi:hypothetical protein